MTSGVRTRVAYGRMLVVEDDALSFQCLERIVSKYRPIKHAKSFESGLAELRNRRDWCGFVFDVMLSADYPDGGLQLLEIAMKEFPGVPAAIVTGHVQSSVVNRGAMLGAIVIFKPLGEQEMLPFLQKVIAREHGFADDFSERLNAVSRVWKLSPREHEVLAWFVAGGSREGYLAFTGMAETTMKTHVKHMLAKTARASVSDLVSATLRRVLVGRSQSDPPAAAASPIPAEAVVVPSPRKRD